MSHQHCVTGKIHTGNPVGKDTEVAGRPAYVTGDNKKTALLYIPDVFGHLYNNHRFLADTYAKELGATVYVGDFLDKTAFYFLTPEQLKNVDFPAFQAANPKDTRFPQILAVAEELKKTYEKVFVIAYCWGAWGAMMLAAKPGLVDAVSINHPSVLEIPGDLERCTVPCLIVAPYTDFAFPQKDRLIAEKIFDEKAQKDQIFSKIALYPGFTHGFTARGDTGDPFTNEAIEDAKNESVMFFRRFLK